MAHLGGLPVPPAPAGGLVASGRNTGVPGLPETDDWTAWDTAGWQDRPAPFGNGGRADVHASSDIAGTRRSRRVRWL